MGPMISPPGGIGDLPAPGILSWDAVSGWEWRLLQTASSHTHGLGCKFAHLFQVSEAEFFSSPARVCFHPSLFSGGPESKAVSDTSAGLAL